MRILFHNLIFVVRQARVEKGCPEKLGGAEIYFLKNIAKRETFLKSTGRFQLATKTLRMLQLALSGSKPKMNQS